MKNGQESVRNGIREILDRSLSLSSDQSLKSLDQRDTNLVLGCLTVCAGWVSSPMIGSSVEKLGGSQKG